MSCGYLLHTENDFITDYSLVITRGKEERGEVGAKGVKYSVTEGNLTLGGEHEMQ